MGLVLIMIWLVALVVTLAPGIGLAGVICGISNVRLSTGPIAVELPLIGTETICPR